MLATSVRSEARAVKPYTVAIIDQNMCLDHPEFAGKIIRAYSSAYLKNGLYKIINPEAFIAAAAPPSSR